MTATVSKHQNAISQIDRSLRELAANLMRVARGAGQSHEIPKQTEALAEALEAYRAAVGQDPPPEEVDRSLLIVRTRGAGRLAVVETRGGETGDDLDRVVRGALQVAASTLLGQATQATNGRKEIWRAIDCATSSGARQTPP